MASVKDLLDQIPGYFTVEEVKELAGSGSNTFRIVASGVEMVGQGSSAEEKPVLQFADTKKKLVLNKGRGNALASLFGLSSDPAGESIRLEVEEIKGRNQVVILAAE